MVLANYMTRNIGFNIVLFGPPGCGKRTWIRYMQQHMPNSTALLDERLNGEQSLSFSAPYSGASLIHDFVYRLRVQTCCFDIDNPGLHPGILATADGIIFIADTAPAQAQANITYRDAMITQLSCLGVVLTSDEALFAHKIEKERLFGVSDIRPVKVPWVISYNKRDLSNARPLEDLERELVIDDTASYESIGKDGVGVYIAYASIIHKILHGL